MTEEEIKRLRALCDAATPRPWEANSFTDAGFMALDAAFIAAARDAVPALLDEVVRLRSEVARLQDEIASLKTENTDDMGDEWEKVYEARSADWSVWRLRVRGGHLYHLGGCADSLTFAPDPVKGWAGK